MAKQYKNKLEEYFKEPEVRHLKFDDLKKKIFESIDNEKDYIIALSGDEGEGKSVNAAWNIAARFWEDFDIENNVIYTGNGQEFDDKYKLLNRKGVIVIDEAIKLAYKMDFAKSTTKDLVRKYTADVRKEKLACHIMCIPVLSDLVVNFRTHRVKMWIELIDRKYTNKNFCIGIVFVKDRNPFTESSSDPWLLRDFGRIWMAKVKDGSMDNIDEKLKLFRSHPYYFGEIVFPKPSEGQLNKYAYAQRKDKLKYEVEEDGTKLPKMAAIWRNKCKSLLRYLFDDYIPNNNLTLTQKDIEANANFSTSEVSKLLREDDVVTADGQVIKRVGQQLE